MCCRSCFKFDYDLTVEPQAVVPTTSDEITYDTGGGIRLTGHSSVYKKGHGETEQANGGYIGEEDDKNGPLANGKTEDYVQDGRPQVSISVNGKAVVNDGDFVNVPLHAIPETPGVEESQSTANDGVVSEQPTSGGPAPSSLDVDSEGDYENVSIRVLSMILDTDETLAAENQQSGKDISSSSTSDEKTLDDQAVVNGIPEVDGPSSKDIDQEQSKEVINQQPSSEGVPSLQVFGDQEKPSEQSDAQLDINNDKSQEPAPDRNQEEAYTADATDASGPKVISDDSNVTPADSLKTSNSNETTSEKQNIDYSILDTVEESSLKVDDALLSHEESEDIPKTESVIDTQLRENEEQALPSALESEDLAERDGSSSSSETVPSPVYPPSSPASSVRSLTVTPDDEQHAVTESEENQDIIVPQAMSLTSNAPPEDVTEDATEMAPPSDKPEEQIPEPADPVAPSADKQKAEKDTPKDEEEEMTEDDIAMSWALHYYSGKI